VAIAALGFIVLQYDSDSTWRGFRAYVAWPFLGVVAVHFLFARFFPVLSREGRVASLLRYYGAHSISEKDTQL